LGLRGNRDGGFVQAIYETYRKKFGDGLMDMNMDILRALEERGKWKAGILNTYGAGWWETAKLNGEIVDRLKRTVFSMPTTLEIRDGRHIEEGIYFIDPADSIYVIKGKIKMRYFEDRRWGGGKEYYLETAEIKEGY
jgi:hypothetical protein